MLSLVALIVLSILELSAGLLILLLTDVEAGSSFSGITHLNAGTPLLVAWTVRILTLACLWPFTIRVGTGKWPCGRTQARESVSSTLNGTVTSMQNMGGGLLEDQRSPLAESVPEDNETRAARIQAGIDSQIAQAGEAEKRSNGRNMLMLLAYIMISLCAVYMALFIVQIQATEISGSVLLVIVVYIACILLSQVDFVLFQNAVLARTDTEGVNDDTLHEHPLVWKKAEGYCMCGRCRQLVGEQTGGDIVLSCGVCKGGFGGANWSVCAKCYQKHQVKAEEGGGSENLLRNDNGPVYIPKLTTSGFCWRMMAMMRAFAGFIIFALAATTAVQVLSTYLPKVQGDILNALMQGDKEHFNSQLITFGALTLVVLLLTPLQGWGMSMMIAHLNKYMSNAMYKSIISQDIAFFDGAMSGQLTSRLQSDLFRVTQPMPILLNSVYANMVSIVSGLTVCLATSWQLTVLAFVCLSPVLYLTSLYTQWASKKQMQQYVYMSEANSLSTQAIANIRTVRFSGATDYELDKFAATNEKRFETAVKLAKGSMGNTLASSFCQRAAAFFIMFYGGVLVFGEGGFEAGSIYTFTLLWNTLSNSLTSIIQNLNQPVTMMSAGKRIFEIMDLEAAIKDKPDPLEISDDPLEVRLDDVHFAYQTRKELPALRGLSLTVEAGKTTALVGKSGCGKSTVNRLLLRFYNPTSGSIFVNGTALSDLKYSSYIRSIGIVTQDTQLFKATLRDNLTYGLPTGDYSSGEGKAEVERACRLSMAEEFIKELPEGFSTMVGEGGHNLSGGQKQRVSIARALLRRPRLLMLDEATSALDTENEALVQESLNQVMDDMKGNCTILVIAHRLATIVDADKIAVFLDGQVVENGTHTELLELDGEYKRLVQRQLVSGVEKKAPAASEKGKGKGKSK